MTLTEQWIFGIPKAELHLHIEGTLEPELAFALAERNGIPLTESSPDALRQRYAFDDLQSFLDIYYEVSAVLQTADDFADLADAYLRRAAAQGLRHAEIFFDPQTHRARGVAFAEIVAGLDRVLATSEQTYGVSTSLIMCFLRDLGPEAAMAALDDAMPFASAISAVGLDSAEVGFPPGDFEPVYRAAAARGFRLVAHAGEEGPAAYVTEALDVLKVERIDHGIRSLDDASVLERVIGDRIPLTVCPLSNVRLKVYATLAEHPLRRMLELGVLVSVNSDDPAFFGGYVGDNFVAAQRELGLSVGELKQLAVNSVQSSFVSEARREQLITEIADYFAGAQAA